MVGSIQTLLLPTPKSAIARRFCLAKFGISFDFFFFFEKKNSTLVVKNDDLVVVVVGDDDDDDVGGRSFDKAS